MGGEYGRIWEENIGGEYRRRMGGEYRRRI